MSDKKPLLALCGKRVYDPPLDTPVDAGGTRMRTLFASEATDIDNYLFDDRGRPITERQKYANAKRLSLAICDDSGNQVYGEEDVEALSNLPQPVMDLLMTRFWAMQRAEYVPAFLKNVTPAA